MDGADPSTPPPLVGAERSATAQATDPRPGAVMLGVGSEQSTSRDDHARENDRAQDRLASVEEDGDYPPSSIDTSPGVAESLEPDVAVPGTGVACVTCDDPRPVELAASPNPATLLSTSSSFQTVHDIARAFATLDDVATELGRQRALLASSYVKLRGHASELHTEVLLLKQNPLAGQPEADSTVGAATSRPMTRPAEASLSEDRAARVRAQRAALSASDRRRQAEKERDAALAEVSRLRKELDAARALSANANALISGERKVAEHAQRKLRQALEDVAGRKNALEATIEQLQDELQSAKAGKIAAEKATVATSRELKGLKLLYDTSQADITRLEDSVTELQRVGDMLRDARSAAESSRDSAVAARDRAVENLITAQRQLAAVEKERKAVSDRLRSVVSLAVGSDPSFEVLTVASSVGSTHPSGEMTSGDPSVSTSPTDEASAVIGTSSTGVASPRAGFFDPSARPASVSESAVSPATAPKVPPAAHRRKSKVKSPSRSASRSTSKSASKSSKRRSASDLSDASPVEPPRKRRGSASADADAPRTAQSSGLNSPAIHLSERVSSRSKKARRRVVDSDDEGGPALSSSEDDVLNAVKSKSRSESRRKRDAHLSESVNSVVVRETASAAAAGSITPLPTVTMPTTSIAAPPSTTLTPVESTAILTMEPSPRLSRGRLTELFGSDDSGNSEVEEEDTALRGQGPVTTRFTPCIPGPIPSAFSSSDIAPWLPSVVNTWSWDTLIPKDCTQGEALPDHWIFPPNARTAPPQAYHPQLITLEAVDNLYASKPWMVLLQRPTPTSFDPESPVFAPIVADYRSKLASHVRAYWEATHVLPRPFNSADLERFKIMGRERNDRRSRAGAQIGKVFARLLVAMRQGHCDMDIFLDPFFLRFPTRRQEGHWYPGLGQSTAPKSLVEALELVDDEEPWRLQYLKAPERHPALKISRLQRKFFTPAVSVSGS